MTEDPTRWVDDPDAPEGLAELLELGEAPPPLPGDLNAQVADHLSELAATGLVGGATGWAAKLLVSGQVLLEESGAALGAAVAAGSSGTKLVAVSAAATVVAATVAVTTPGWVGSVFEDEEAAVTSKPVALDSAARGRPSVPARGEHPSATSLAPAQSAPVGSEPDDEGQSDGLSREGVSVGDLEDTGATPRRVHPGERAGGVHPPGRREHGLTAEARYLEEARSRLNSDPRGALDATRAHRSRFPNGQLAAERELIAVDALLRLGRRREAERRAEALLGVSGLYERRARRLLER